MTDEQQTQQKSTLPPSYHRRYEFNDGDVEVLAKFAAWIPGAINRLYTYAAREITIGDVELYPPSTFDEESPWSNLRAYTIEEPCETIVYYLDTWGPEARVGLSASFAVMELHELTHQVVPEEDNERQPGHGERWNRVLCGAVEHVMDIDSWEETESYPTPETVEDEQTTAQTTLRGVQQ